MKRKIDKKKLNFFLDSSRKPHFPVSVSSPWNHAPSQSSSHAPFFFLRPLPLYRRNLFLFSLWFTLKRAISCAEGDAACESVMNNCQRSFDKIVFSPEHLCFDLFSPLWICWHFFAPRGMFSVRWIFFCYCVSNSNDLCMALVCVFILCRVREFFPDFLSGLLIDR